MRNAILFIIFLIFSFFINVVFYYISDDYRQFLKNIKSDSNISVDDSFLYLNKEKSIKESLDFLYEEDYGIVKPSVENDVIFSKTDNSKIQIKSSINLGKNYIEILDIFSSYDFQELELNTNLFDITDEYPDNYIEYYSRDLTLYFFPTKGYKEVYDIFSVLEFELPFKINETNSFGEKSFFINLNQDINDTFVRTVISHKGIVFGLKIKKNEYNKVKERLNILRNN